MLSKPFTFHLGAMVLLLLLFICSHVLHPSLANPTIELLHVAGDETKPYLHDEPTRILGKDLLLLTTGEQIKLFPISINENNQIDSLNPQDAILVRPKDFDPRDPDTIDRLGPNSTFTKWIQHKHLTKLNHQLEIHQTSNQSSLANIRQSILPKARLRANSEHLDDHDDDLYSGLSEVGITWNKPSISKVGYFFNDDYCKQQEPGNAAQCLVVFWLDKANRYLRFGSVLLSSSDEIESNESAKSSATTTARIGINSTLWLNEFPPIDLCGQVITDEDLNLSCDVLDLTVEPISQRATIIMSVVNDTERPTPGYVLGLGLTPNEHHLEQISSKSLAYINNYCEDEVKAQSNVAHLNYLSPRWAYYLERSFGSKLMAIDLASGFKGFTATYDPKPTVMRQFSVFDIRSSLPLKMSNSSISISYVTSKSISQPEWPPAMAMAIDRVNSQLFFLLNDYNLYSSDLMGENARYIGQLSQKPAIRSPTAMHVHDGYLFFSDLVKKSLIAYKLPSNMSEQQTSGSNHHIKPTHQVLIVEVPTIYDFRIIDSQRSYEYLASYCRKRHEFEFPFGFVDTTSPQACRRIHRFDYRLESMSCRSRNHCVEYVFIDRADGSIARCHISPEARLVSFVLLIFVLVLTMTTFYYFFLAECASSHKMLPKKLVSSVRKILSRKQRDEMSCNLTPKGGPNKIGV